MAWDDDDVDPSVEADRERGQALHLALMTAVQVLLSKTPGTKTALEQIGPASAKNMMESGDWGPEALAAYVEAMKAFTDVAAR